MITKGHIANLIDGLPSKDRAKVKARELGKIQLKDFSQDGFDIEVIQKPREVDGLLKVWVRASKNGQKIPVSNPLIYKNPPILVPDGTKHTEIFDGQEVELDNYKEDAEAALQTIIVHTIKSLWRP